MSKISKDAYTIKQLIIAFKESKTNEERETLFIQILEFIYLTKFYKSNDGFRKMLYKKIIELYYDAVSSKDFKQNLNHYMYIFYDKYF
jgi:hypothetical protein